MQVFVVAVETVVLQLHGCILEFDALVLQREAQCLFLQSPLGEFVGDMLKLQLLVLQLQVFALVLGSCCFEGMRLVEGDISRLSGVEGVGIFLVSHLQVIGILPSPQLGISV